MMVRGTRYDLQTRAHASRCKRGADLLGRRLHSLPRATVRSEMPGAPFGTFLRMSACSRTGCKASAAAALSLGGFTLGSASDSDAVGRDRRRVGVAEWRSMRPEGGPAVLI